MGQLDQDRTLRGSNGRYLSRTSYDTFAENTSRRKSAMDMISSGVGSVTSRDQIINPMDLIDPSMYENTRAGRAQYESDLAALINFQSQQEAAYQEWYDSPEQAAARERSAGLNPDLIGLENAGSSAEAAPSEAVPGSSLPTNGQIFSNFASGLTSILQTAGSLAGLPLQFSNLFKSNKLLDEQTTTQQLTNEQLRIGNVSAFESIAHKAIADKYAVFHAAETAAGRAVDTAKWFADDANFADILPSYAPSDDPRYVNALSRVRKGSESILAEAYKTTGEKIDSQVGVARLLANPYVSDDTKLMVAQLSPVMEAVFELERETTSFNRMALDAKHKYLNAVDPTAAGEAFNQMQSYEAMLRKHQQIIENAKSAVYENLKITYSNAPHSPAGFAAGLQILGQTPASWSSFLTQYGFNLLDPTLINEATEYLDVDGDPTTNEGGSGYHMGRPSQ